VLAVLAVLVGRLHVLELPVVAAAAAAAAAGLQVQLACETRALLTATRALAHPSFSSVY
jgi:hypothetical protein